MSDVVLNISFLPFITYFLVGALKKGPREFSTVEHIDGDTCKSKKAPLLCLF